MPPLEVLGLQDRRLVMFLKNVVEFLACIHTYPHQLEGVAEVFETVHLIPANSSHEGQLVPGILCLESHTKQWMVGARKPFAFARLKILFQSSFAFFWLTNPRSLFKSEQPCPCSPPPPCPPPLFLKYSVICGCLAGLGS